MPERTKRRGQKIDASNLNRLDRKRRQVFMACLFSLTPGSRCCGDLRDVVDYVELWFLQSANL